MEVLLDKPEGDSVFAKEEKTGGAKKDGQRDIREMNEAFADGSPSIPNTSCGYALCGVVGIVKRGPVVKQVIQA